MFLEVTLRILINVFIVSMLFWMIFWDSEPRNPIKRYWIPKIQPLFIWLGLHSNWSMFSPDPPNRTIWPRVRMFLRNSDFVDWEPTPIDQMTIWDKIRFKKFHKFYHEVARPGTAYQTKRDFIEYLLRRLTDSEPCVKVEIYLIFRPGHPFEAQSPEPPKTYKRLVFTLYPASAQAGVE